MHRQKSLLLVSLLLAIFSELAGRPSAQSMGDDSACLQGFRDALDPNRASLNSWTEASLKDPCTDLASNNPMGIACNNKRVYSITLNATNLAGTIPPSLADCTLLEMLDISSNRLSGPIPSSIGNLSYLVSLNLSNNQLDGSIPVELSMCAYLNVIDLHVNKLTGPIPGQIGLLQRLKVFDASDNKLSGAIPSTLSNTSAGSPRFNVSSFKGNSDLYGYPLPMEQTSGLSVMAIVGIGLASGLVSLVVSSLAVCLWLRVTEQGYAAQEGKISHLMSET